jgi:hypothetical protein
MLSLCTVANYDDILTAHHLHSHMFICLLEDSAQQQIMQRASSIKGL